MQTQTTIIDAAKCTACGECIKECPAMFLGADSRGKAIPVRETGCIRCGHCIAVCPVDAVTLPAYAPGNFPPAPALDIEYAVLKSFLRRRRSVRRYENRPVSKGVVEKLLDAARYAPTGTNRQACRFQIVYGAENVRRIAAAMLGHASKLVKMMESPMGRIQMRMFVGEKAYKALSEYLPVFREMIMRFEDGGDPVFFHAPLLVGLYDEKDSYTGHDDCVIAGYHMILAAETLGLGSCINGFLTATARHSKPVRDAMRIPASDRLYFAVGFGWPDVKYLRLVDRFPGEIHWIEG